MKKSRAVFLNARTPAGTTDSSSCHRRRFSKSCVRSVSLLPGMTNSQTTKGFPSNSYVTAERLRSVLKMLRYPATTITLTMAEVKVFEQRQRFKQYLAREAGHTRKLQQADSRVQIQPIINTSAEELGSANVPRALQHATMDAGSEDTVLTPAERSPKRQLALQPRRAPKVDGPNEISLQSPPYTSQSATSNSDAPIQMSIAVQSPEVRLPPPFSMSTRTASDERITPSVSVDGLTRTYVV